MGMACRVATSHGWHRRLLLLEASLPPAPVGAASLHPHLSPPFVARAASTCEGAQEVQGGVAFAGIPGVVPLPTCGAASRPLLIDARRARWLWVCWLVAAATAAGVACAARSSRGFPPALTRQPPALRPFDTHSSPPPPLPALSLPTAGHSHRGCRAALPPPPARRGRRPTPAPPPSTTCVGHAGGRRHGRGQRTWR